MHHWLDIASLLTLLPLLVLQTRQRKPKRGHALSLGPDSEPSQSQLSALLREFLDERTPIHPSAIGLVKYLAPEDAISVTRCADAHLRWADPKTNLHELKPRQCRSFWCAWCVRLAHARRSRYQYLKLQSIQPADDDAVRLLNIVAELPRPLHALVRHDDACMNAWRAAIEWTIAETYGYTGRQGKTANRACWRELGAIFNFHAIGDEGAPFPKYFPHFDILLSAYKVDKTAVVKLPTAWPEKFSKTRDRYRANLRKHFLPLVTDGAHKSQFLEQFLRGRFRVYWHVGKPPEGAGEGNVHIRNAGHRIRYSCRPLFGLDNCKLDKDHEGTEWLIYEPTPDAKKPIRHVVLPRPAFGALRDMKRQLAGRHARFIIGALAGKAYTRALGITGRKKVVEQEKTGKTLVGAYVKDKTGKWHLIDPRDLRRI